MWSFRVTWTDSNDAFGRTIREFNRFWFAECLICSAIKRNQPSHLNGDEGFLLRWCPSAIKYFAAFKHIVTHRLTPGFTRYITMEIEF